MTLHVSGAEAVRLLSRKARGTHTPGCMNGTETEYAALLEFRKRAGDIKWYAFEAITLKLADSLRYTPDFMVMLPDGSFEFHETKGFWQDDALVKIKVAADKFPFFRFIAIQKVRKKDGGGWKEREF